MKTPFHDGQIKDFRDAHSALSHIQDLIERGKIAPLDMPKTLTGDRFNVSEMVGAVVTVRRLLAKLIVDN